MKKLFCLLLALIFALSAVSCSQEKDESESPSAEPDVSPEASSVDESRTEAPAQSEEQKALDGFLRETPDRSKGRTNILLGKSYVSSRTPNADYADGGSKLTDGVTAEGFDRSSWVGYDGGGAMSVTFDLGEEVKGIADVDVCLLRVLDYGIGMPSNVSVYASADGKAYFRIASESTPVDLLDVQTYNYVFRFPQTVDARFLRIDFSSQEKSFLFVDEISAFVYDGGGSEAAKTVTDYYGTNGFKGSGSESFWSESESDYATVQNMAKGKTAIITEFSSIPLEYSEASQNSPSETAFVLTDGNVPAFASWDSSSTFRFTRGIGRRIIVDLEHSSSVSAAGGCIVHQQDWGVIPPEEIVISVSVDGVEWQNVGSVDFDGMKADSHQSLSFSLDFGKNYKARYVSFSFLCETFAAFTELTVTGSKAIGGGCVTPSSANSVCGEYVTEFEGYKNILCLPLCSGSVGSYDYNICMPTAQDILPYTAYLDEDGNITDTFMDAYVVSPSSQYAAANERRTLASWKHYIDSCFLKGYGLDALNEATRQTADALKLENHTSGVLLSVLYPFTELEDGTKNYFGDLDGDGKDDAFSDINNRKAAMKWMVDEQLKLFNSESYGHLKLAGFYWQEESVLADEDGKEIINYITEYIHSLGYKILWIPFYNAEEYDNYEDYGFDTACLQPNYSFVSADASRLSDTAFQAKLNGMCVEIECGDYRNLNDLRKFREYLQYGVKYGYMNALKVYYIGGLPGELYKAKLSGTSASAIYRDCYLFAGEKLDASYNETVINEITTPTAEFSVDGRICKGKIKADGERTLVMSLSPKYCVICLNTDGSFSCRMPLGYTGSDAFEVVAVYESGVSESVRIEFACG